MSKDEDKPGDGDKGSNPDLPQGERSGKPIIKILPFCPRATAEGMAESESVVHTRFLTGKPGRDDYGGMV